MVAAEVLPAAAETSGFGISAILWFQTGCGTLAVFDSAVIVMIIGTPAVIGLNPRPCGLSLDALSPPEAGRMQSKLCQKPQHRE